MEELKARETELNKEKERLTEKRNVKESKQLKRKKQAPKIQCHHDNKEGKRSDGEDRISGLPDEIIVMILSRLTFKEAMSTSILSRRWRYIWTFITSNLNFDTGEPLCSSVCKVCLEGDVSRRQREILNTPKFVGWVNHVVKEHQGSEVDQFRVCYSLDTSYSSVLDAWVNFTFQKRVRELELNLTKAHGFSHSRCYSFPSMEKLNMLPMNYTRLISLRLMNVDVTAEVVQYFLAKCPFLEQLCVVRSHTLSSLKIGGESPKLKYLDWYRCMPLENLEISAPNLVSFAYSGPKKEVPFKNVPLLSELCLGDQYCESFILEAPKHSSYLSQLEKLTLVLPLQVSEAPCGSFPSNLSKLFNLKQLELRIGITRGKRLDRFTSLIKAAPLLSKFVLKVVVLSISWIYYVQMTRLIDMYLSKKILEAQSIPVLLFVAYLVLSIKLASWIYFPRPPETELLFSVVICCQLH